MTAHWLTNSGVSEAGQRRIVMPRGWTPRWYQRRLFGRLDAGIKRAVCVWHRRAGKDVAMVNYAALQTQRRVGTYWHMLPTAKQARKAIWEGITSNGVRIIDQAFPRELVRRKRDDEMMIEMTNGAIWRLVGGDNYDALVGSNVLGVTYSEYAITDPQSWNYVRPILTESQGWAAFISTPRGKNHFWELYQKNRDNAKWFVESLNVEQTGAIPLSAIQDEIDAGMPPEKVAQEFYVSFEAANYGAVYGNEMALLQKSGQITSVPYDPRYPVETAWDWGQRDSTAIWFLQRVGGEVRAIDLYVNRNKLLPHYLNVVNGKGYAYARHIMPHDMDREFGGTGDSLIAIARQHGLNATVAPKSANGIEALRALLPSMKFDEGKCEYGIKALEAYHYDWDEELRVMSSKPVHDWSSHPCDALRYYAVTPDHVGAIQPWARKLLTADREPHRPDDPSWYAGAASQQRAYDPLAAFR